MKIKKYIYLVLPLSLFSLSALAETSDSVFKPSAEVFEKAEQGDIQSKRYVLTYYQITKDYLKELEVLYSLMDDPKLSIDDEDYQEAITKIAGIYFGQLEKMDGKIEKNKERFEQVIDALNKVANSHNYKYAAEARYYLAKLYYYGLGTPKNPKLAYEWAIKAAGSEVSGSSSDYGFLRKYESLKIAALLEYQGLGVEENREAAIKKIGKLCEIGKRTIIEYNNWYDENGWKKNDVSYYEGYYNLEGFKNRYCGLYESMELGLPVE